MARRNKILWVSHFLPYPPKGGAQIRSFNLLKELAKYHDIYLYCIASEAKLKAYFDDTKQGAREAEMVLRGFCSRVEVQWLAEHGPLRKYLILLHSLLSNNSYSMSLIKDLDIENLKRFSSQAVFDFVHLDTVALAQFQKHLPPAKTNLNHHNIESDMMIRRAKKEKNWLKKLVYSLDARKIKRSERRASHHVDVHIVCSQLDQARLERSLPGVTVRVIENGIDVSDNKNVDNTKQRAGGLFIGGLDWYPNSDAVKYILANIWPIVVKNGINTTLDVVGKNPSGEIINLAKKFNNVKLHGFVDDIDPFYNGKKFFLCPIRDGGGTKLKILDAMANGIPVVAHPIAFEGIDAAPGVHYFSASSAEEFAVRIAEIVTLPQEVLNLVAIEALDLVRKKYSYLAIGRRLADLYGPAREEGGYDAM